MFKLEKIQKMCAKHEVLKSTSECTKTKARAL